MELWHMIFFPSLYLEFSKYSTENTFIIGQEGQFSYFQKPKFHCPFNVGIQPRPCSWTASVKGPWECSGRSSEACHIWKPSMGMTSPLEFMQHKPCLWELAEISQKTWRVKRRERADLMRELVALGPKEVQCMYLRAKPVSGDQFLGKSHFSLTYTASST